LELRPGIAFLHQDLQILLGLRHVTRLKRFGGVFDAREGRRRYQAQSGQANDDRFAADSIHGATPTLAVSGPSSMERPRRARRAFSSSFDSRPVKSVSRAKQADSSVAKTLCC